MFNLPKTFFVLAALLQCAVVLSSPLPSRHQGSSAMAARTMDDAQAGGLMFKKRQIVSATVDAADDDDIADSDTPDLGLSSLEGIVPLGILPRQVDDVDSREDNYGGRGGYGAYDPYALGYPQLAGPIEHTGLANFGDNLGDALSSVGDALGGLL